MERVDNQKEDLRNNGIDNLQLVSYSEHAKFQIYHRQNRLQKESMRIYNIFKVNGAIVQRLRDKGIDVYNLGPTRMEKLGVCLIMFSLCCPGTFAPITVPILYKLFFGEKR